MDPNPGIVIVSSSNTKPKSIIKLITGETFMLDEKNPDKIHHVWQIDTKYYTANVSMYGITENFTRTDEFNEKIEALIIHMDSNKLSGLDDLKKWESICTDCEPEVKLLISNYFSEESKVPKAKAIEWCLKRGFELIELYPNSKSSDKSEDSIIEEKTGVARVIEALQAHIWPNLVMKDENDKTAKNVHEQKSTKENSNSLDSDDLDDFTDLFSHLQAMKESIKGMPVNQRKQCAEQMVTAFWKAIGGDEDELEDLESAVS